MPEITVLICCYNGQDFLERSLKSALGQTMDPGKYEVVVVDDGSTDATPAVLDNFREDGRVRVLTNRCNLGLVASRNRGLEAAHSQYLVRLDADDLLFPTALDEMTAAMDQGTADLVYSDRVEVHLDPGWREVKRNAPFNLYNLIASGVMLRLDLVRQIGGYRPLFWEEYDLHIRYLNASGRPPCYVPKTLYQYSRHPGSMTADASARRNGWKELLDLWGIDVLREYGSHEEMEAVYREHAAKGSTR